MLSIASDAEVDLTAQQTIGGLEIDPGGKLDIGDAGVAIQYGSALDPTSTIAEDIRTAYDSGQWDGLGLTSSAAAANSRYVVGYSDDTANQELLIRYTLAGDFNLDGIVNTVDFDTLADNFNQHGKDAAHGDSNYDGIVNATDFDAIAINYGQTVSTALAIAVPADDVAPSSQPALRANLFANSLIPSDYDDKLLGSPGSVL